MKKRDMIISAIIIIVIVILVAKPFNGKDSDDVNSSSQIQNLIDAECDSNQKCNEDYIESYCEGNDSYKKLHDFSCIKGKCVEEIRNPELFESCSGKTGKYECKKGICEPISVLINSCGFYLNTEGEFYKLTKDIAGIELEEPCITIMKDSITFDCDGYAIESSYAYAGVYSEGNHHVTIKNCDIQMAKDKGGYGIYLYNNLHSSILNNILNNQYMGLYLEWDSNSIIKGNTIKDNNSTGLWIEKGIEFEISDNIVCGNDGKDLRLRNADNIQGTGNKFGNVNPTPSGWPMLDRDYVNCTS